MKEKKGKGARQEEEKEKDGSSRGGMGALTTSIIAIAGLVLSWAAIEIACKPCLQTGREALNKSLDPNYDVDDELENRYIPPAPRDDEEEEEIPEGKLDKGSSSAAKEP